MQNKTINLTKKLYQKALNKIRYFYRNTVLAINALFRLISLIFLFCNIFPSKREKIESIAFIGDFSGLHLNLKQGFINMGLNSLIYSDGDDFKKVPCDYSLSLPPHDQPSRFIFFVIDQPLFLNLLFFQHDIVQIISARFIYTPYTWQKIYLLYLNFILRKSKAKFVLTVGGCDHKTQKILSKIDRSPCPGCLKDMNMEKCFLISQRHQELQTFVESKVDLIMPFGGSSYLRAYSEASCCLPFPLKTTTSDCDSNYPQGKIKIMHGISRAGFKGSNIIVSVLRQIEQDFPDNVEILVFEKLPWQEYILCLNKANIVIDQAFGDGLGYNSLYSLSLGKIVFTSHSPSWILSLYGKESPAIDFWDEDSLYQGLVKVCSLSYREIDSLGRKGYDFVKDSCSPEAIASKALSFYSKARY